MTKKIIVSCGSAIATSTVAAKTIEDACNAAGIEVITHQCKVSEIQSLAERGADLIVTTSNIQFNNSIPVVNGMPFLTGIGKDGVIQEILAHLSD